MKNLLKSTWKSYASLAALAVAGFAGPASAALTVTLENQSGTANTWPFTPAWTVNTNNSLIAGLAPSQALGDFSKELAGRSVNSLTLNTNLTIGIVQPSTSTTTNYVTCGNGSGAGSLVVYTLPASSFGYDLTNITVYGGWANSGRDAQAYTVLYSTVGSPNDFKYLTSVSYNPTVPANTPSSNREIIRDNAGGVIAANVASVKFDFDVPAVENGFVGYAAITVGGTASTGAEGPGISISTANQNSPAAFTPNWVLETPNLIAGLAPTAAVGNFNQEDSAGTSVLTDGLIAESGNHAGFATAGATGGGSLVYTLPDGENGIDVTNVTLYTGWGNADRDGQYFILSYATVSAPTAYIPITTVFYNPAGVTGFSANRVSISMNNGLPLATAVSKLKFDFAGPVGANQFDHGYSGYSEIVVQGTESSTPPAPPSPYLTEDTLPSFIETVVGDQVVFTAAFSNAPPANVQWEFINAEGTLTNDVPGATSETLTLNNVQLSDAGSYRLKAVNATNNAAAPSYSLARTLSVKPTPTAVNGIIVETANHLGAGVNGISTNFFPTWSVATDDDLILGATPIPGDGDFSDPSTGFDPILLTDGTSGFLNYWPNVGGSETLVVMGGNRGKSVTYTLPPSTYGYDITNIVVYGGWGDSGRDQSKYQILYSVDGSMPSLPLITVDYNPSIPSGLQSATRTTLVPTSPGGLVRNVTALTFNFDVNVENGYVGVSEIVVGGQLSPPMPTLAQDISPLSAETVTGDHITLTASFNGADSYQWQKDGTNISDGPDISGATTTTLTLSQLQTSDTATNGGYRLAGINSSGTAYSTPCALVVKPLAPATNNVVISAAGQIYLHHATYTPDWITDTSANNLIYLAPPTATNGGFGLEPFATTRDISGFTDGGSLTLSVTDDGSHKTTSGNYLTAGNGTGLDGTRDENGNYLHSDAGHFVVYQLPASANGYDLTNITTYGGWADAGRDQQAYVVLYSTVANPGNFLPLGTVSYNPVNPADGTSATRVTLTPGSGSMAQNVGAVMFDFRSPGTENGFGGYAEITINGVPSATPETPQPVVTAENQTNTFTWTVESPNLIANRLPDSFGPGLFTNEGCNITNLTDGIIGFGAGFGTSLGAGGAAVPWIIFNSPNGWDLTNIVVYSLWHDYGRDGQFYTVSYSTLSDPSAFVPLSTVYFNPDVPQDGTDSGNRVEISPIVGQTKLASNVAAVKFDFTIQGNQDFAWSGYSEIVLQGVNLNAATPPLVEGVRVTGGNLVVTGTGSANSDYTILTTTNLAKPLAEWTISTTGVIDGAGSFSNAIPVDPATPARFFRVRTP
ncbi:MAG TPA: immunoglobulin domain-containing protein [Verrucomicrobiae bacterium]|nr:immunoglobulin domain-containing protein [Verrucomicrobiae bacterium]